MRKYIIFILGIFSFLNFQIINGQSSDYLRSSTATGSATTSATAWGDICSVSIDLGSNIGDTKYVMVTASINMRSAGTNTNIREANYNIYRADDITDESGDLVRLVKRTASGVESWGLGTLVHIFDVTALSGTKTYTLEHRNTQDSGNGRDVFSSAGLTAVALSTATNHYELSNDVKRIGVNATTPVTTASPVFSEVTGLTTNDISLPIYGDIFVTASINSQTETQGETVAEYRLEYSANGVDWSPLGKPVKRTVIDKSDSGIISLTGLLQDQSAGNYKFRVAHRQVSGQEITTERSNLVAVALAHSAGGSFPSFYSEVADTGVGITGLSTPAETVTSSTFTGATELAGSNNALYVNTQYLVSPSFLDGTDTMIAANQLFIDNGTTTQTADQYFRYMPSNGNFGAGGFSGLLPGLVSGTNYTIGMEHVIADIDGSAGSGDEILTTSNVILTGFQTYSSIVSWGGTTDNDWSTATNWGTGEVPSDGDNVIISDVSNPPTASGPVSVNSVVINSGASLIAQSDFTGAVTYNRTLGTNNWYLVGSPVVGEAIENLIANHTFASGTGPNIGIAPYKNDGTAWDYQALTSTSPLVSGGGYSVKLANAGDISFSGTMPVNDAGVGVAITVGIANAFNLIGNPYPSYIPVNTSADATNNILKINDSDNDFLSESTIWLWNQATSSYEIVNQGSPATFIAPAQGFFVSSSGSNTFSFTEAMQSHQSADSFQRTENSRSEINLVLTNGSATRDADIFYLDGMTTGFDNGYDSSIFGAVANQFAIYTHAVANSTGKKLGIQSLPNTDFENMIIPVGINAVAGTEITISANSVNMPLGLNIFLEDRDNETFTLLDTTSDFTTTLPTNLNGIGRFYLHTAASALDIGDYSLDHISVYRIDLSNLRIVGVQNGMANLKLYNMLGKQVLEMPFKGNGVNTISLPNLQSGVYIVTIETESGILNKKIVL